MYKFNLNEILLNLIPNQTTDLVLNAVKKCPGAIFYAKVFNQEICDIAIKYDPLLLNCVPEEYVNDKIIIDCIIKQNSLVKSIEYVSAIHVAEAIEKCMNNGTSCELIKYLQDYDYGYAMRIIKANPMCIKYITPELVDYDMCMEAIYQNINCLYDIPDKFITEEMVNIILNSPIKNVSTCCGYFFIKKIITGKINLCEYTIIKLIDKFYDFVKRYYPDHKGNINHLSRPILMHIISANGHMLEFIDDQDYEIVSIAIKNNPISINYVKDNLLDDNLILEILDKYGYSITLMKNPTYEHYLIAATAGLYLKLIPEEYATPKIIMRCIKNNADSIRCLKKYDGELIDKIYKFNPKYLELVDTEMLEDHVLLKYHDVSRKFKVEYFSRYPNCDINIIQDLSKLGVNIIPKISENMINYDMCEEFVKNMGLNLQYIPKKFVDYELCLKAVFENGYSIKFVDKHIRDKKLISTAIKSNPWAIQFISPDECNYSKIVKKCLDDGLTSAMCIDFTYVDENIIHDILNWCGNILEHIENQTLDMCLAAVKSDNYFMEDIKINKFSLTRLEFIKDKKIKNICQDYLVSEYIKYIESD